MKIKLITIIALFFLVTTALAQVRYDLSCRSDILAKSKLILMEQVGIKENSNRNDGLQIKEYLASVGLLGNLPYCCAGQYWCFWKAVNELGLKAELIPIKRTGRATELFFDAKKRGKKRNYRAEDNSFIVWKYPNSFAGHIERIIDVHSNGWVTTIAFNTTCLEEIPVEANELQRNRKYQGVCMKRRNIYHPLGRLKILGLIGFERCENEL